MFTLINKTDKTSYVPYESINISQTAGDPQGKATFQVIDPGSLLSLTSLQEVIFVDETAALGGVTLTPAHNYVKNNNFNFGTGGWNLSGSLSGDIAFPSSGTFGSGAKITITFSNANAANSASVYQNIPTNYAIPGQQYCLSASYTTSGLSNASAFVDLTYYDGNNNVVGDTQTNIITNTSGRFSVTATAPAGTVLIQVNLGAQTTVANNNAAVVTITAIQLEPVWFPALYAYPTPICDFLQANCVTLPDGTTSRLGRIFCGNITHMAVSYEGTTRIWDIEATSLSGMLENATLVNAAYNNVTDQSIITGVVNSISGLPLFAATPSLATGTPQALAYANVPVCYSGVAVADLEFADATIREVLNSLNGITGFLFGADSYYNVFYYPPFVNEAPYGFAGNGTQPDNVSTFPYYDYSIEYDASQIQNAINVSGSTYVLQITESFHALDGTHSQIIIGGKMAGFNLTFPPAGSIDIPQVTFGGTLQTTALDTNVGFGTSQTLLQFGNHIGIATSVTAGTAVSVTYTYDALVYVQVQSPDSIAAFGRPLYSKINDTNLVSNAQATTSGEAQLQTYAQPRVTLKFKTAKYLAPGQTIEFTSTLDGITKAHYTIQKVTATYLGDGVNQYEVEAGVYLDDFVDFFRNSQKAINRADHDPTETIKTYNNLQMDSASYTDSLNIHT